MQLILEAKFTQLQVICQFRGLIKQMEELINDFSGIISVFSTESDNFDRVLHLFQSSAIVSIIILTLLVPFLWLQIFQNWRMQILKMRLGRYEVFGDSVLFFVG